MVNFLVDSTGFPFRLVAIPRLKSPVCPTNYPLLEGE